jgi:hypothetical protein
MPPPWAPSAVLNLTAKSKKEKRIRLAVGNTARHFARREEALHPQGKSPLTRKAEALAETAGA